MADRNPLLIGAGTLAAALFFGTPAPPASAQQLSWASVAELDDYAWIDRAEAMSEAVGDAPPDFAFDYQGQEVWAWALGDRSVLIVEQRIDGPHSYYFDAGADAPFLVRRTEPHVGPPGQVAQGRGDEMSFGYRQGMIAVVYTADGDVVGQEKAQGYTGSAMDDWERGRELRRAMRDHSVRRDVSVPLWVDFADILYDWALDWDAGVRKHPGWRRHHYGADMIAWRQHYEDERRRREDSAAHFWDWNGHGFHGAPPGHYAPPPPGWTRKHDVRPHIAAAMQGGPPPLFPIGATSPTGAGAARALQPTGQLHRPPPLSLRSASVHHAPPPPSSSPPASSAHAAKTEKQTN